MKLKMKNVAYVGDMYYSQDGTEYAYYGKGGINIDGALSICQIKKENYSCHGGGYEVERHKWVDVSNGDNLARKMKSGFDVDDQLIGVVFRKVHRPQECNPW